MDYSLDFELIKGKTPIHHEPVIIVGGGLAGLTAAIQALKEGANVILLEKEKDVGGNSEKASSGINGCETTVQKSLGIADSYDLFYSDSFSSGGGENEPALLDILVHNSASAIEFLVEQGIDLCDVNLCGGHSVARTHWIPSPKDGRPTPVGLAIIRALKSRLQDIQRNHPERLEIRTNATIIGLVTWNEHVTGVRLRSHDNTVEEVNGKAVILASGGFASDLVKDESSLMMEFAPKLINLPSTNGHFATGDGIKMARAIGAELVTMDHVQVHPTAFIDPKEVELNSINPAAKVKFLAAEALRGKGAILVNEKGKRFANELGRRDYLTEQINKYCAKLEEVDNLPVSYMLMTDTMADAFGRPAFNFYFKTKGFFKQYNNAEEFANEIGCQFAELNTTLDDYNKFCQNFKMGESKNKDSFGKSIFPANIDSTERLYAARITPALHYTMGGLKIDTRAYVYNGLLKRPFQGLLAAGEVIGGVHGRNRLAGNSLLECVVFGRIAGRSAAQISSTAEGGDVCSTEKDH